MVTNSAPVSVLEGANRLLPMPDIMPLSAISEIEEEAQWLEGTSVNSTDTANADVDTMVNARAILKAPDISLFCFIVDQFLSLYVGLLYFKTGNM